VSVFGSLSWRRLASVILRIDVDLTRVEQQFDDGFVSVSGSLLQRRVTSIVLRIDIDFICIE